MRLPAAYEHTWQKWKKAKAIMFTIHPCVGHQSSSPPGPGSSICLSPPLAIIVLLANTTVIEFAAVTVAKWMDIHRPKGSKAEWAQWPLPYKKQSKLRCCIMSACTIQIFCSRQNRWSLPQIMMIFTLLLCFSLSLWSYINKTHWHAFIGSAVVISIWI